MKHARPASGNYRRILIFFGKYAAVVLVLSLSFIPIYQVSFNSIKESAVGNASAQLQTGMASLDSAFERLVSLGDACSVEPHILKLSNIDHTLRPDEYSTLLDARQYLNSVFMSDRLISSMYLLFQKNSLLISSNFIDTDTSRMYGKFYRFGDYTSDQWREMILNRKDLGYFLPAANASPVFEPMETARLSSSVLLVIPIPTKLYREKTGAMVCVLNEEALYAMFQYHAGFTYIIDRDGRMVASHNFSGDALTGLSNGVNAVKVDGSQTTVIQMRSSKTGLTVVTGIPDSVFSAAVRDTLVTMWIILGISLAFTLLMAIYLAFKDSIPLARLLHLAEEITHEPPKPGRAAKEWDYLTSTLTTLHSEIDRNRNSISNHVIVDLLLGRLYTKNDLSMAASILAGVAEHFCVCAITVRQDPQTPADTQLELISKVSLLIRETLCTQLPQSLRYLTSAPSTAAILSFESDDAAHLQRLQGALSNAQGEVFAAYGVMVYFGIGTLVSGMESITQSYKNARYALRYCDDANPVIAHALVSAASSRSAMDSSFFQRLRDVIVACDKAELGKLFEDKVRPIFKQECKNEVDLAQNFYRIRGSLFNLANDFIPDRADFALLDYSPTEAIDNLIRALYETCSRLIDEISAAKNNRRSEIRQAILRYIDDNYADSALSALTIAQQFSISEKYVFNIVKEETGKTLGDFMEDVRFAHTEELLRSGVAINSIPERVGYNSINTFYKAFKRRYGVSPKAWNDRESAG